MLIFKLCKEVSYAVRVYRLAVVIDDQIILFEMLVEKQLHVAHRDFGDGFVVQMPLREIGVEQHFEVFCAFIVVQRQIGFYIIHSISEYSIVKSVDAEKYASNGAKLIKDHMKKATGANIPIITDGVLNYSDSAKYIVVNSKKLFDEAGLTMPEEDLGLAGFTIQSKGNSVFIQSKSPYGAQNGAVTFLEHVIGYEMYSADMEVYAKAASSIKLPRFNVVEKPDFEISRPPKVLSDKTMAGMKMFDQPFMAVNGVPGHNTFAYLPLEKYAEDYPEWYADNKGQLCYTAHGNEKGTMDLMQNIIVQEMIETLEKPEYEDYVNISFTIQDNGEYCGCESCSEENQRYGSRAGSLVKFCNALSDKLDIIHFFYFFEYGFKPICIFNISFIVPENEFFGE